MSMLLPVASTAKKVLSGGQGLSREVLGYDFVGLIMKLVVFFVIAIIADWYFKAAIGISNGLTTFLDLLGFKIPQNTNSTLAKLFGQGWNGINFWTLVQFMALAMVAYEAWGYYKKTQDQKGSGSMVTLGVFGIILFLLALTSVPQFLQKMKEANILKTGATTTS